MFLQNPVPYVNIWWMLILFYYQAPDLVSFWLFGLEEVQAGIKISRRNINNLRYADDTTLMTERKRN